MHGVCQCVAYAQHGTESVGARTQMRYLAQEFKRVSFLLQRIFFGVGCAVKFQLSSLYLYGLPFALRCHQLALHMYRGAGGDVFQIVVIETRQVEHNLQVLDCGAVVERHKLHVLVAAACPQPAFDVHCRADEFVGLAQKLSDRSSSDFFHCCILLMSRSVA